MSERSPKRPGPKARWGQRVQVCSKWPVEHRDHYERLAREQGISLNEYLVRFMAAGHGFIVPPDSASPDRQELPTGA